jgi:hypothetical protein
VITQLLSSYTYLNFDPKDHPDVENIPRLASKLVLANNCVKDEGLRYLSKTIVNHPRLVYLNLQNNDLTDVSLCTLFRCLQRNHTVIHLDIGNNHTLGRNKLRQRGAEALKGLLCNNSVLQILNLENLGVNIETFETVIAGVSESNVISLNLS